MALTTYLIFKDKKQWIGKDVDASDILVSEMDKSQVISKISRIASNNKPSAIWIRKADGSIDEQQIYRM